MHKLYSHAGIVLSSKGVGEKNSVVVILSEKLGLVRAKAISSRESKAKLKGHLVPYSVGVYTIVRGKVGWRLIQAEAQKNIFFEIKNIQKRKVITRTCDLIISMAPESPDRDLFACLKGGFDALYGVDTSILKIFEVTFIARILKILGYLSFNGLPDQLKTYDDFSDATLLAVKHHEKELIMLINQGLKESQLVKTL